MIKMLKRKIDDIYYISDDDDGNEQNDIGDGKYNDVLLATKKGKEHSQLMKMIMLEKYYAEVNRILNEEPNIFDITLKNPFTLLLTGKSGCGKTFWLMKLLSKWKTVTNDHKGKLLKNILWFYGIEQKELFDKLKNEFGENHIEFIKGLNKEKLEQAENGIIVLDDLMSEMRNDTDVAQLFTKCSHHKTVTVFILWQTPFPQGKTTKEIATNVDYQVVFNNERQKSQLTTLCQQMTSSAQKGRELFNKIQKYFDNNKESYPNVLMNFKSGDEKKINYLINFLSDDKKKPCEEL